ncbi:MAG: GGDEF domain-containing protein [Bryobacterales bacterium]|nr:GGDEF domain-containing protein [Bryobacterales bacterium]
MISFRKSMEADELRQRLHERDREAEGTRGVLLDAITGVREHALRACPPVAGSYEDQLLSLEKHLRSKAGLDDKFTTRLHQQLEGFGRDAGLDYENKATEIREVVRLMAAAAESFATQNASGSQELSACANALESIAALEDLSAIRRELQTSVQNLRQFTARKAEQDAAAIASLRGELEVAQNRLAQAESQANHDPLTSIVNRRGLERSYRERFRQTPATVVLFDLNRFKQINDAHGHAAGDAVLIEFARRLQGSIRNTDVVARWGGDEFIALLGCPLTDGLGRSRQLLSKLCGAYVLPVQGKDLRIPVSAAMGLAEPVKGEPLADAVARADAGLYKQKGSPVSSLK